MEEKTRIDTARRLILSPRVSTAGISRLALTRSLFYSSAARRDPHQYRYSGFLAVRFPRLLRLCARKVLGRGGGRGGCGIWQRVLRPSGVSTWAT